MGSHSEGFGNAKPCFRRVSFAGCAQVLEFFFPARFLFFSSPTSIRYFDALVPRGESPIAPEYTTRPHATMYTLRCTCRVLTSRLLLCLRSRLKVVIVPGYGLAVAGAQYAIADAVKILTSHGVKVTPD